MAQQDQKRVFLLPQFQVTKLKAKSVTCLVSCAISTISFDATEGKEGVSSVSLSLHIFMAFLKILMGAIDQY